MALVDGDCEDTELECGDVELEDAELEKSL
jgi:hypothetical protein